MMRTTNTRPLVVPVLIGLFAIGTVASLIAVITLTFPGSFLDVAWRVNPHARESFSRIGAWSVALMSVVFVACLLTAIGLWRRLEWGYWLALVMLIMNLIGDAINVIAGKERRALVGIPIVLILLLYLLRRNTRDYFRRSN
jgi:lysylphosphatidylglycerol synthetase-like protein (DUF2156 family)